MMIIREDWEAWYSRIAVEESAKLSRRYGIDQDDIYQEFWVYALTHQEKVLERYESDEGETLAFFAKTEVRKWCAREKASRAGYSASDQYYYTIPQLRILLPDVFDYDGWTGGGLGRIDGQPTAVRSDPRDSTNRVTMLADVAQALLKIPEHHYNAIIWKYKYNYTTDQLADALDTTAARVPAKVHRAIASLRNELGGVDPMREYIGDRKVVSNAASRAMTEDQ